MQHPHPAKAPDKCQDQDKNGREGWKDEVDSPNAFSSVWHHPGSALSAQALLLSLPWLLVLVFQLAALAPGVLQLRGREGGRGPASSTLPRAWRWACLYKFSPIHTVSAHSLRHQAYSLVIKLMVTILEGNPGHCRGKVIERF